MSKKRLGKGFEALISSPPKARLSSGRTVLSVPVSEIKPNPRQPRHLFDENSLEELAKSIKDHDIAQPLLVRKQADHYELVAGERRLRAAKKAGLSEVPIILKELDDQESLELAIIENVQREDLNPMDEAASYRQLMDEFQYTQEEVAKKLGKSRPAVANTLRLLDLPAYIQDALRFRKITAGHARALLGIKDQQQQKEAFGQLISGNLNVRQAEQISQQSGGGSKKSKTARTEKMQSNFELFELGQDLSSHLGTKVSVQGSHQKGSIHVAYFSKEDLERIIEIIKK